MNVIGLAKAGTTKVGLSHRMFFRVGLRRNVGIVKELKRESQYRALRPRYLTHYLVPHTL